MIRFWQTSLVATHRQWVGLRKQRIGGGKQRGFSLLELMIVLAILAILLVTAAPSFSNIILRATLASQARELMAASILARSEAIKRNQVVTLCASNNGTSCTDDSWANGWIVIAFSNQVIQKHEPLPDGFLIKSALTRITFDASGMGASMASLTICRATPSVGSQERVVSISATGRPSVTTTEMAECSPDG